MGDLQFPKRLAAAVRSAWPEEEVLAPHARKYGLLRRLFTSERILVRRILPSEPTLAFWEIASDGDMTDFLFDALLPALSGDGGRKPSLRGLPVGYKPLREVLEFEQHSQWEGFADALVNCIATMSSVIEAYRFLDLDEEAKGIAFALSVARSVRVHDNSTADSIREAYSSATTDRREFDADSAFQHRMSSIGSFIRRNPQFFAARCKT